MLSQIEQLLLFVMIFSLMIGIGCSLDKSNIAVLFKQKKSLLIGLALQYLSMPLLALAIVKIFGLSSMAAFTLVLVACCPGGTTSNIFTYYVKGNTELSIVLTSLTTTLAFIMTPTLLKIFSMSIDTSLEIPLQNLVSTLVFVLLPVGVGLLIKSKSSELAVKVEKIGSILGSITILIMIVIWFPKVFELVKAQSGNTFAAIGLMSFIGILIGFVISKLSGASAANAKALAFETGIQNAPLAFAIITLSLSKDVLLEISWIPLLYGALSVGNAIIFMGIFKGFVKTKKAAIT